MTYYLIDYENVNSDGLKGVNGISPDDKVVLFFNDNSKLPVSNLPPMISILSQFEFKLIRRSSNNYLDFYLSATVGKLTQIAPESNIVIISRDKGYSSVLDFCLDNNVKASWFPNIAAYLSNTDRKMQSEATPRKKEQNTTEASKDAGEEKVKSEPTGIMPTEKKKKSIPQKAVPTRTSVPEFLKKKVREALQKDKVQAHKYTQIYKAFLAGSRKQFLANLSESFGKEKGLNYYQKILPVFREFIK